MIPEFKKEMEREGDNLITSQKLVWYMLSALTTVLLLAAAAWGNSIDTRQTAIELQESLLMQHLAGIDAKLDLMLDSNQREKYQKPK